MQVNNMLKLKYGRLVSEANHTTYVSNATLGKVFGCSGSKVRQLCLRRFKMVR